MGHAAHLHHAQFKQGFVSIKILVIEVPIPGYLFSIPLLRIVP
jgi:hypothetical protein